MIAKIIRQLVFLVALMGYVLAVLGLIFLVQAMDEPELLLSLFVPLFLGILFTYIYKHSL